MLNQTTRYVLSVLCYLATRREDLVPARRIAADTTTPANYVGKILGTLSKQGIVVAEKGWGGGYALGPKASQVPVGDLLRLFDEHPGPVECPFPDPICGCRVARERVASPAPRPHGMTGDGEVICPYGAPECLNPVPCPLQAHWGRVREGYRALAETRVADLTERVAG
ncbi:MAG: Rrf2 family transcriptional regulator [Actinobacteria bacterium]|nr:Rrf2 family transcriptional regulator [Actinomycetota bacterium]